MSWLIATQILTSGSGQPQAPAAPAPLADRFSASDAPRPLADRLPADYQPRPLPPPRRLAGPPVQVDPEVRPVSAQVIAPVASAALGASQQGALNVTAIESNVFEFTDITFARPIQIDLGQFIIRGDGASAGETVGLYEESSDPNKKEGDVLPGGKPEPRNANGGWSIKFESVPLKAGEHVLYVKATPNSANEEAIASKATKPSSRFRVVVPDGKQPPLPSITGVSNGKYAEVRPRDEIQGADSLKLYGIKGAGSFLRLEGVYPPPDPRQMRFFILEGKKLTEISSPMVRLDPQAAGRWVAQLNLPWADDTSERKIVVLSQQDGKHNYSGDRLPFKFQTAAKVKTVVINEVKVFSDQTVRKGKPSGIFLLNSTAGVCTVETDLNPTDEAQILIFPVGDSQPIGVAQWKSQDQRKTVTVDIKGLKEDKQNLRAEVFQGDRSLRESDEVTASVRLRGPRVLGVEPSDFGAAPGYTTLMVTFNAENTLDNTGSAIDAKAPPADVDAAKIKDKYRLWASKGTGVFGRSLDQKTTPQNVSFDEVHNTIALEFAPAEIRPDIYQLEILAADIKDVFGNTLEGVEGKPGSNFVKVLGRAAGARAETPPPAPGALARGIRATTGPNVEFPEYTKPRDPPPGFNPSDHVETRVARLYYFRDAHRVAQIINREVKSFNRAAVDAAEQLADKARADADAATDARQVKERGAVEAAQETRRLEHELQSAEQNLFHAQQRQQDANQELDDIEKELSGQKPPPEKPEPERTKNLQARKARLEEEQAGRNALIQTAADQVRAAVAAVQQARTAETQAREQWLQAQAKEDRSREDQFRREVAAAHEDPDTYVNANPESVDPVRRVSISVIGEGLIQLRGPIKGINIIRMMINQIDAPVGQVRVGIHTVQINGEHGDKMEKVADRVQKYIDHSRFLTMQSAEMLRKAVAKVAAIKAAQCGIVVSDAEAGELVLGRSTQGDRDRRYLHAFFGADFIAELEAMDSEFLKTGNKLLSLHSMDTTSLASALFVLALAKNTTRMEILREFEEMCRGELPAAEMSYFEAGWSPPGKKLEQWFCKEKLPVLACNARFQSLRGMLDGDIEGPEIISPIQREFIRLAQIFKSRLIVELQYKQRLMERAVIEERLGNRKKELEDALERERVANEAMAKARSAMQQQRATVVSIITRIDAKLDEVRRSWEPVASAIRSMGELSVRMARAEARDPLQATMSEAGRRFPVKLRIAGQKGREQLQYVFPSREDNLAWRRAFRKALGNLSRLVDELSKYRFSEYACERSKWEEVCRLTAELQKVVHLAGNDGDFGIHESEQREPARAGEVRAREPSPAEAIAVEAKPQARETENVKPLGSAPTPERAGTEAKVGVKAHSEDDPQPIIPELVPDNRRKLIEATEYVLEILYPSAETIARQRNVDASGFVLFHEKGKRLCSALLLEITSRGEVQTREVLKLWLPIPEYVRAQPDHYASVMPLILEGETQVSEMIDLDAKYQVASQVAEDSRRPLDHKKFLDMLIDEMEDKYIELLEGTRAHTANIDAYIKRLVTALDDDFNTQFYLPAFRQVRTASRAWDVSLGQIELTSILANNREFAKVSPEATMEFDLPKRDILITEAMKGAKAAMDEYGALLQDPTFLALTKMGAGLPTSSPPKSYGQDFATVRNVLPGLPGSSAERIVSQSNPGTPQIGAAFEALIPDPAIYKFETGTGYEIRPVIQPDGQAVVFHLNYMYTTNVREPVRADEKHLGRVKRHFIDTDVQLSNYELREVSRYQVALKASRTGRGVPLLENVPVAGVLFRPLPSAESSLQENMILGQATIFPTLFDLMGLRWAPAIADLDPLRVVNDEFVVRGRNRALMNRVFDHSSSKVDEYLRIPEAERRADLYRSQETIPHEHPDGYRGPGLNLRDSKLEEGLPLRRLRPETPYVPGAHKEGILFRSPDDPPAPSGGNPGQSPPARPDDSSGGQGAASGSGPQLQQGRRAAPVELWQRLANPRASFARPGEKTR